MIKGILEKPKANIVTDGKRLKALPVSKLLLGQKQDKDAYFHF